MEEVKGMIQAKEEAIKVQTLADQQLAKELEKRGYQVNRPASG